MSKNMSIYLCLPLPSLSLISYFDTLAHTTSSRDPALTSCPASLDADRKTPIVAYVYVCEYMLYMHIYIWNTRINIDTYVCVCMYLYILLNVYKHISK